MSREDILKEAEAFVRKAVARLSKAPVGERTIKMAAEKVAKAVPVHDKPKSKVA